MRAVASRWLAVAVSAAACGGSVAHTETAKPARATAAVPAAEAASAQPVPAAAAAGSASAPAAGSGSASAPASPVAGGPVATASAASGPVPVTGSLFGGSGVRLWMNPTHVLTVASSPYGAAGSAAAGGTAAASTAGAPERVDGGEISRAALLAVLSNGIGRFLQKVRAEAHLVAGRFVGWRLLSLFDDEPAIHVGVLQPGDTVMRVNGQSIERPEQFKNVWDSMATESELILLVQRGGRRAEVRYRIVDTR